MTNSSAYTNGEVGKVHYAKPGVERDAICREGIDGPMVSRNVLEVTCQRCVAMLVTRQGVDRVELIHAMRREGVNDAVTGKVLGITRERVRQLGGNVTEDKEATSTYNGSWKSRLDKDAFLVDVKSGEYNLRELCEKHGIGGDKALSQLMRDLGVNEEYRRMRIERRNEKLKDRLREFAAHWRDKTGMTEYSTCDLIAYDHSLYGLVSRSGYLVEWSREVGLYYETGEKRLKNGNRDGEDAEVDRKFARRRKVSE